jgi:UPF0176 protein
MQKIILYYIFTPLADPDAIRLWQRSLCESLGLKGRILISRHGLNGTVGGDIEATKSYEPFKKIVFKWSDGTGKDFPRLSVRVRDEIVSFGAADELQVDAHGVVGGGVHLKPNQVNELVEKYGDDVIFFDGRNGYEAQVGKFKNAIIPDVRTSKDFIKEIEDPKYDAIKDKPIVTYCTGGIRCEILSALMKNRGFKEVYQVDGGIVKYGEAYKDKGLWEGALYVFDDRLTHKFSDEAVDIGRCIHCAEPTSNFINCQLASCNAHVVVCEACAVDESLLFHTAECRDAGARLVGASAEG